MTRMSFLVATLTAGLAAIVITVAAACGGGGGEKTPAPTATTPSDHEETPGAMASPASREELEAAFATAQTQLQEVISKAQAGDAAGAKEAYEPADDPLHMIEDAVASVDASLADSIEKKQHDEIEDPLDSGTPDLEAIAKAAQDILPLLDEAASKLDITPSAAETPASKEELTNDLAVAKSSLQEAITKANAGDRDAADSAFEEADKPLEAIIDALKPVDAALADSMEGTELDLEDALDATPPKLDVVADKAQDLLTSLDEAASKLELSP